MKFGEKATLRISGMDKKGRGTGTVGTRRARVPFSAPGEEVEGSLLRRDKGDLLMKAERIITPSPARTVARCAYAGTCGGCAWQQFDYAAQLLWKRDLVNEALVAAGIESRIDAVVPAPSTFYYRNRMDYCVGPRGEIGLKEPGRWNAFLDLSTCYLLSTDAVKAMDAVREWMKSNEVKPWDNVRYEGYLRYVVIREGKNTGERMVMLVTSDAPLPAKDDLLARLEGLATSVVHGINPTITDTSIPARMEALRADVWIEEEVTGKRFRVPAGSFFQTNTAMAAELLAAVRGFLDQRPLSDGRKGALLDLYCGVGFFGISLADRFDRVTGIELDDRAIAVAAGNAERNGVTNAAFTAAKAEQLDWKDGAWDTVLIDPPRAGLHPKVTETLLAQAPERIVYVSCNYESFARDWQGLKQKYRIAGLRCLDLFPHSPHVETVALLVRQL